MKPLEEQILDAHARGQGRKLAHLYAKVADSCSEDREKAAFFLTHAYVFALELGMAEAKTYYQKLKSWGKEE